MNTHAGISGTHQGTTDKHTIVSDVHHDTSDTEVIVPDVRRDVSNTNPIVSGVRRDVVNTPTDIRRNKLKSREGVNGRNQAVSTTYPLPVTE